MSGRPKKNPRQATDPELSVNRHPRPQPAPAAGPGPNARALPATAQGPAVETADRALKVQLVRAKAICVAAAAGLLPATTNDSVRLQRALDEAHALLAAGDYAGAYHRYRHIVTAPDAV